MPPQRRDQLVHAFYWTRRSQRNLCVSEWPPQVQAWGCFLTQALETSPPPSLSPSHILPPSFTPSVSSPLCPLTGELLRQCSPHLRLWDTDTQQQDYGLLPYLWIKFNLNISEQRTGDQHVYRHRKEKSRCESYLAPAPINASPHHYQSGRWVPAQRGLFNVLGPLWYDTW